MGGTQLTELTSSVRVIDVATTPFLSPEECDDVIGSCAPDAWYAGTRRAELDEALGIASGQCIVR